MADDSSERSLAHDLRLVLSVLLVAALVALVVDNRRDTRVDYIVGHRDAPLWFMLTATAVVGVLIGALLSRHRAHRQ
jgi:uncharacterized integral membrane protein